MGLLVAVLVGLSVVPGSKASSPSEVGDSAQRGGAPAPCPERGGGARPDAPFESRDRLARVSLAALEALAADSEPLPCGASGGGGGHGPADHGSRQHEVGAEDRAALEVQWDMAVAAAQGLATGRQASAAGYVQSSPQGPGVGAHWIKWPLVDRSFDPAKPSMLLFDQPRGSEPRLVGFSYWVRSAAMPTGFVGGEDEWHSHAGLCFFDGWLLRENVPSADDCAGQWLNGDDLWMLHAWVVPAYANPDGRFASTNPLLCPHELAPHPDIQAC